MSLILQALHPQCPDADQHHSGANISDRRLRLSVITSGLERIRQTLTPISTHRSIAL
jgi:hypothetical protein